MRQDGHLLRLAHDQPQIASCRMRRSSRTRPDLGGHEPRRAPPLVGDQHRAVLVLDREGGDGGHPVDLLGRGHHDGGRPGVEHRPAALGPHPLGAGGACRCRAHHLDHARRGAGTWGSPRPGRRGRPGQPARRSPGWPGPRRCRRPRCSGPARHRTTSSIEQAPHRVVGRVADDGPPGLVQQRPGPAPGREEQRGQRLGPGQQRPARPGPRPGARHPVGHHAHQQVGAGPGPQLAGPLGQALGGRAWPGARAATPPAGRTRPGCRWPRPPRGPARAGASGGRCRSSTAPARPRGPRHSSAKPATAATNALASSGSAEPLP
jgi:hypothetical protein